MPTESNAKDSRPVKGKDYILPKAQMKGASLRVEPLHQSLRYRVPYGIRQSPQDVLEALLNQKCAVACISPRVKKVAQE